MPPEDTLHRDEADSSPERGRDQQRTETPPIAPAGRMVANPRRVRRA